MKWKKSKRYTGVYSIDIIEDNKIADTSYYITYKLNGKTKNYTVGKKSAGFNESLAYKKRAELVHKINNGESVKTTKTRSKGLTLNELASVYFDDKSITSKDINRIQGKYNKRVAPILGEYNIKSLSIEVLKDFRNSLIKEGLAPKTINGYVSLIKTIINYGIKIDLYSGVNTANKIELLKVDNKRESYLNKSNCELLLNNIEEPILDNLFNRNLKKDDRKNRLVIHTLRHSFASMLAMQGTPILTIQKLMNYKGIKTTMIYAYLAPDNGRIEVDKLF